MHTKGKRNFKITPYMANSKVTKHLEFLPMKHGTKTESWELQKGRGRAARTRPTAHWWAYASSYVQTRTLDACLRTPTLLITRCYRAKRTHAPKKALYRLVGNLKGAVREITGLTHVWASHLHYHRAKKYHISMPHRQHEIWHWLWSQASPGLSNMAATAFCQSIFKTENKTN